MQELEGVLGQVVSAGTSSGPPVEALRSLEATLADDRAFQDRKLAWYRSFLDHALADERLSAEEQDRLDAVGEAIFGDTPALLTAVEPYRTQLFVAMVNDGRLPESTSTTIILKRGEVAHLEEPATVLKEVIQREFQSGSRGYSFRIMKGVSYRVGSSRGKMVEVGRSLVAQDEGTLTVTSQRLVFTGTRRTIEAQYAKLINLGVYNDAIQVHVSNRQTPTTFGVRDGTVIAAAINAAVQRML